jgi:protein TonB
MSPHVDILEQREHLRGPFVGSLLFHAGLAVLFGGMVLVGKGSSITLGSSDGGRPGSVLVNPVSIPLPNKGGPVNPVANDTKSQVPTPPPEKKAQRKPSVKVPDPKAIALPTKKAPAKPSWWVPENKFRAQQKDQPNQVFSKGGQRLSSPMLAMPGGGGDRLGTSNMPFGMQFGGYADLIVQQVARAWNRPAADSHFTNPRVTISFTLKRDGSISDVKISQRSGMTALDYSAQRAIMDAAPFPPFPAGFNKTETGIDFVFELGR